MSVMVSQITYNLIFCSGLLELESLISRSRSNNRATMEADILTFTMMTSSNGNIFRVTGHLCGEFTGPRWIPHTKASDAELWCLLWSAPDKWLSKQSWGWWFETLSCSLWRHRDAEILTPEVASVAFCFPVCQTYEIFWIFRHYEILLIVFLFVVWFYRQMLIYVYMYVSHYVLSKLVSAYHQLGDPMQ